MVSSMRSFRSIINQYYHVKIHPRRESWATETGEAEKQRNQRKPRTNGRLRNQDTNAPRPSRRPQFLITYRKAETSHASVDNR
jgi:hypothetical protein